MKADPILKEKRILVSSVDGRLAIAELRIWRFPKTRAYPHGVRYSLFLVSGGQVIVGYDNHQPKGPHLHIGSQEFPYKYSGVKSLIDDFWDTVRKAGFEE
jgi:hypothetical protein